MKRVYTADSSAMAWHIKNILEHNNIPAVVKNELLSSIAGEMPITECQPQVWVLNNLYFKLAEQLIKEAVGGEAIEGPDWFCRQCHENNLANFAICWNCQSSIDEESV
ncbi:MAG: hypothetical protein ACI95C_000277 [Pseudohongiellaceae bacterium]|jgi:hypothetical protein